MQGEVVFNNSSNTTQYGTLHTLPIHPTTPYITFNYLSTLHLITCSLTTLSTSNFSVMLVLRLCTNKNVEAQLLGKF